MAAQSPVRRAGTRGASTLRGRCSVSDVRRAAISSTVFLSVFVQPVVNLDCPVRVSAVLEDKNQLVLAAVERPHAGIVLGPDAEVLQFGIAALAGGKQLARKDRASNSKSQATLVQQRVSAVRHRVAAIGPGDQGQRLHRPAPFHRRLVETHIAQPSNQVTAAISTRHVTVMT